MAPIEDYALLGDLHTAALVGCDGAIDLLCLPRFDKPACFAALLGTDDAGTWRLAPASGGVASRRRYRGESLVLESEWDTRAPLRGEGMTTVADFEVESGQRIPFVLSHNASHSARTRTDRCRGRRGGRRAVLDRLDV